MGIFKRTQRPQIPLAKGDDPPSAWWHSIELENGEVTSGYKTPERLKKELHDLGLQDLSGMTVLDIGAWDGFFSFAAEEMGAARVVALDYHSWIGPEGRRGFDYAKSRRGSSVEPITADFMEVDLEFLGKFDIVLFLGVLYHLQSPMTALERLAAITTHFALIETEAIALAGHPDAKMCEFYETTELANDPSNWWAPTGEALTGMCRASGFRSATLLVEPPQFGPSSFIEHYRAVCRAEH